MLGLCIFRNVVQPLVSKIEGAPSEVSPKIQSLYLGRRQIFRLHFPQITILICPLCILCSSFLSLLRLILSFQSEFFGIFVSVIGLDVLQDRYYHSLIFLSLYCGSASPMRQARIDQARDEVALFHFDLWTKTLTDINLHRNWLSKVRQCLA